MLLSGNKKGNKAVLILIIICRKIIKYLEKNIIFCNANDEKQVYETFVIGYILEVFVHLEEV